jgi:hypothetical protein
MKKSPQAKPVLPRGRAVVGIDIGKGKHAATALSPQGEIASSPNMPLFFPSRSFPRRGK